MNRLLSWPGAKYRQMTDILEACGHPNPRIVVEPFFGTGAFTWTVGGSGARCWAAEADEHLYWWWYWLLEDPPMMVDLMAAKREEFRDAGHDRAVFDALRDGYNEGFAAARREPETAAQLWVLVYQSTNNLARFNSNGFYNQTWGQGRKVPDPRQVFGEEELDALRWFRSSLHDGFQGDFRECIDCFLACGDKDGAFVFLDPPYIVRTETYQRGAWKRWDEEDLLAAARRLDEADVPWAWTTYLGKGDVVHPFIEELQAWTILPLDRKMDARPTAGGTPAEEVIILGQAVDCPVERKDSLCLTFGF